MGANTTPELRGLDQIDRSILLLIQENPAIKQTAIAEALQLSKQTICKRMAKQSLKNAVIDLHGSIQEILDQAKRLAARRIKRHILSDNEKISLRACTEVLRSEIGGEQRSAPAMRFVTVVNDVGVLESRQQQVIEADLSEAE